MVWIMFPKMKFQFHILSHESNQTFLWFESCFPKKLLGNEKLHDSNKISTRSESNMSEILDSSHKLVGSNQLTLNFFKGLVYTLKAFYA